MRRFRFKPEVGDKIPWFDLNLKTKIWNLNKINSYEWQQKNVKYTILSSVKDFQFIFNLKSGMLLDNNISASRERKFIRSLE